MWYKELICLTRFVADAFYEIVKNDDFDRVITTAVFSSMSKRDKDKLGSWGLLKTIWWGKGSLAMG